MWTASLLRLAQTVTALDASPEMLEITRSNMGDARVSYQQANLFTWEPAQQYDLVFFAFWLSHVPPERLNDFFAREQRAVRPGGQLFIIDQYAPLPDDLLLPQEGISHTRTLHNGRAFQIVKVFHNLATLEEKLARPGFTSAAQKHGEIFFSLVGTRNSAKEVHDRGCHEATGRLFLVGVLKSPDHLEEAPMSLVNAPNVGSYNFVVMNTVRMPLLQRSLVLFTELTSGGREGKPGYWATDTVTHQE